MAGRLEGALDPDGKVTYVFGEDFPSATALRAWGFVVSDHYDPRQLSSHEAHFGESEDMEPYERAHPDWTMSPDDLPD
ncbi:MAG: hypothetical protein ACXVXZ_07915 [Mycobacteriaceae bacterium]